MKRPKVSIDNRKEAYAYFAERRPRERNSRILHGFFGLLYRPRVEYEGDPEEIRQHFDDGGQVFLYSDHKKLSDAFVLAALAKQQPALQPLMENTVITGKSPIFKWYMRLLRPFVDDFPTIPAFRGKEFKKYADKHPELLKEEVDAIRAETKEGVVDANVQMANEGMNVAMFPQGSRSSDDVKSGMGAIACRLANPDNMKALCIGISYEGTGKTLSPNVYIGQLALLPTDPDEVTKMAYDEMAKYSDLAAQMRT